MSGDRSKPKTKRQRVTFSLEAAGGQEVALTGSFNNWDTKTHLMKSDGNGIWRKTVMLYPGEHQYKFLIDGDWKEDPQNDHTCPNSFGTQNSVLHLTAK